MPGYVRFERVHHQVAIDATDGACRASPASTFISNAKRSGSEGQMNDLQRQLVTGPSSIGGEVLTVKLNEIPWLVR